MTTQTTQKPALHHRYTDTKQVMVTEDLADGTQLVRLKNKASGLLIVPNGHTPTHHPGYHAEALIILYRNNTPTVHIAPHGLASLTHMAWDTALVFYSRHEAIDSAIWQTLANLANPTDQAPSLDEADHYTANDLWEDLTTLTRTLGYTLPHTA